MPTTLAQILAKWGALPATTAIEVVDRLAAAFESDVPSVLELLALRPETIEVQLKANSLDVEAVAFKPALRPSAALPYLAWPEYGARISGQTVGPAFDPPGEPAVVYCLGVLLYHMLADQAPFVAADLVSLALRHLTETPPALTTRPAEARLACIVKRCMARQREQRFESLQALHDALRSAVRHVAQASELVELVSVRSGRRTLLGQIGQVLADGTRVIRVGRNDRQTGSTVDVDLRGEPNGRGVHRRQGILRQSPNLGWTVEEWQDPAHPRTRGQGLDTMVNKVPLQPRDRRALASGDIVSFGPVDMTFSGSVGETTHTPDHEAEALAQPVILRPLMSAQAVVWPQGRESWLRAAQRW